MYLSIIDNRIYFSCTPHFTPICTPQNRFYPTVKLQQAKSYDKTKFIDYPVKSRLCGFLKIQMILPDKPC